MVKSRFVYLHPDTNPGKIAQLDTLHVEYVKYVRSCVALMIEHRRFKLKLSEMQNFFEKSKVLTSQIQKNARHHAIQIVSAWSAGKYATKLLKHFGRLKRFGEISPEMHHQLCTLGKWQWDSPKKHVTQFAIDQFWVFLLDEKLCGKVPQVRDSIPMRMSEKTCRLGMPDEALHASFWLKISTLQSHKVVCLPLSQNPYVKSVDDVTKGILARKDKRGRWRFDVVERREWVEPPESEEDDLQIEGLTIGVDVGLNVLAATSDGQTYGAEIKPKFDKLYNAVKRVWANRQRQGLKKNSIRLNRLETKLTGMVKTATGEVVNKIISRYLDCTIFVLEDLDLRGCKGQKRFAYRALAANLARKAITFLVNPAYTSQMCPSCGYVSRSNRLGVKFHCRGCGRISHADVIGAINLQGRSLDKQINCNDNPQSVKALLRERYRSYRDSSSPSRKMEPVPSGPRLTTVGKVKNPARHSFKSEILVYPSL